ncbi:YesK family protein [Metabacillus malikii]|uniref:Uncharacterized protein n=1 Tax=Metabacillus malikii TaxID=1504265 RepID=A0ABT9ZEU1_9BACI|nr:YesK family protein [Metabacillus malikii]MDQ0230088.1 hypothetical protein [Metabacillus malikii]
MYLKKSKVLLYCFYRVTVGSTSTIIISIFIGGWRGMGYGIIGVTFFIGTILGGVIHSLLHSFLEKTKA